MEEVEDVAQPLEVRLAFCMGSGLFLGSVYLQQPSCQSSPGGCSIGLRLCNVSDEVLISMFLFVCF